MWAKTGGLKLIDLGCNFFIVKLGSKEDYRMVLTGGPWMIFDSYLTLRGWESNFDPNRASIDKVAAWLRIPDLPTEYYNEQILTFMGNRFGRTLKVDFNTIDQTRAGYARLCVNLDLSKPLVSGFKLEGRSYRIEYEGLHNLCRRCGRVNHPAGHCTADQENTGEGNQVKKSEVVTEKKTPVNHPGTWTVVQRTRRTKKEGGKHNTDSVAGVTGSRFGVLAIFEEQEKAEEKVEYSNDKTVNHQTPKNSYLPMKQKEVSGQKSNKENQK